MILQALVLRTSCIDENIGVTVFRPHILLLEMHIIYWAIDFEPGHTEIWNLSSASEFFFVFQKYFLI